VPAPIREPPFSYRGNSADYPYHAQDLLAINDVEQASAAFLRNLFSGAGQGKPPTKAFVTAQLDLYGIPFRRSDTVANLRQALKAAVDAGQCEELAPSRAAVRDRLRAKYDEAFTRFGDTIFADITGGPAEEASADPPRFVAKYFLDADGKPDRNKTKDVLRLSPDCPELLQVVEGVPGLAIRSTRVTVLVGWETEMQRGVEAEFARFKSLFKSVPELHSAQASLDLGLFLKRHLGIGPDGAAPPAGVRPRAAVQLSRWWLEDRKLPETIMAKNPRLCKDEFDDTVVISWDADSVAAVIASLRQAARLAREKEKAEERAEQRKKEAQIKARWDRRSKGHTELKKQQPSTPQGPLTLQRLVGSYLVLWDNPAEGSNGHDYIDLDPDDEAMRLDVFSPLDAGRAHGVKASFHLGWFEGTMLLGMTRRDVELLRDMQRDHTGGAMTRIRTLTSTAGETARFPSPR